MTRNISPFQNKFSGENPFFTMCNIFEEQMNCAIFVLDKMKLIFLGLMKQQPQRP